MISKKLSLSTAIGFGFASALTALNPAQAATVPGCGEVGPGATLTNEGDYCEAIFSDAGVGQLTLPEGVSDLYGIVVAGGGGASRWGTHNENIETWDTGYAGNGGEAESFSWSGLPAGATVDVEVGAAGISGDETSVHSNQYSQATVGGDSSVSINNSAFSLVSAGGGSSSGTYNCNFPGSWEDPGNHIFLFVSRGTSGTGVTPVLNDLTLNETCPAAPGLNPASLNSIPIFSNATADFARGGGVYDAAPTSNQLMPGEGASLVVNTSTQVLSSAAAAAGIVILRYEAVPVPVASAPTYAISFDANGATSGSAPVDSSTYLLGSTTTVWPKSRNLIKNGFTFTGWNTAADGSGTQYAVGSPLKIAGNVKLFAQWKKNTVAQVSSKKISTFVGNSSALSSSMKLQVATWIRSVPANAQIVCNGSTSGKAVTALDVRLAKARAVNVCKYAVTLRPQVTYKITLSPSSSSDVSARSVWLTLGF